MNEKKKKEKKENHPTLFVLDGAIRHYEDGTLFSLYSQITSEEWQQIAEETVKYEIYLNCLKEVACPILEERWGEEDEWFRLQLNVAVERVKEIDPLFAATFNRDEIYKNYSEHMRKNAKSVAEAIQRMRIIHGSSNVRVSNL